MAAARGTVASRLRRFGVREARGAVAAPKVGTRRGVEDAAAGIAVDFGRRRVRATDLQVVDRRRRRLRAAPVRPRRHRRRIDPQPGAPRPRRRLGIGERRIGRVALVVPGEPSAHHLEIDVESADGHPPEQPSEVVGGGASHLHRPVVDEIGQRSLWRARRRPAGARARRCPRVGPRGSAASGAREWNRRRERRRSGRSAGRRRATEKRAGRRQGWRARRRRARLALPAVASWLNPTANAPAPAPAAARDAPRRARARAPRGSHADRRRAPRDRRSPRSPWRSSATARAK